MEAAGSTTSSASSRARAWPVGSIEVAEAELDAQLEAGGLRDGLGS